MLQNVECERYCEGLGAQEKKKPIKKGNSLNEEWKMA